LDQLSELVSLYNARVADSSLVKKRLQPLDRQRDGIQQTAGQVATLVVRHHLQDPGQNKQNCQVDRQQYELPPHDGANVTAAAT